MGKKGPDTGQMAFTFEAPTRESSDEALADLPQQVARTVAQILNEDPRSRYELAGEVSRVLGQDVSKLMLDAYASPAREDHRISLDRMLALVAVTVRYDALGELLRRIGATLLVGEEVFLAEIGHQEMVRKRVGQRLRELKSVAQPLNLGGRAR